MAEGKHYSLALSLGVGGLKMLASGPIAMVVAVGAAAGLLGFGIYYLTKAEENKVQKIKMQERQSSGYLHHSMVTTGIAEENKVQKIKMQERQSSGCLHHSMAEENKVQKIKMQERQSSGCLHHSMVTTGIAKENKVQKIKMQERQSSGYLRHVLVTTGIVTFLLIFFYCFTSFLTYGENSIKLCLGNRPPAKPKNLLC